MKVVLVRLVVVVVFFILTGKAAQAQPYRYLTAEDFRGIPQTNSGIIAYTHCSINFSYVARRQGNYYMLNFTIGLKVNNDRSWMNKQRITSDAMLTEVLKHEQGHYTIAYMEQQELLRAVTKTVFYADYQAQAREIFDRIDAKYKQLNTDYDDDTQHMTNRDQQQSWDAYFKKRLDYMPPV